MVNSYFFIAIALDETTILVAVHFSMKNIYQSCDHVILAVPWGGAMWTSANNVLCLLTFV